MGISRRAYARHRGCVESAVRKAIKAGRITLEPDGTIDPERADAEWNSQTDPAMQRGDAAHRAARETARETQREGATKPVPQSAIDAVQDTLQETGTDPEPEAGGQVSFMRARMANEVLKAQLQKERLKRERGEVVDRARATSLVFDLARRERDAWIGWAPRVAANMAAELGIDPHQMEVVLDKYLREHLAELAEVKVELR